MISLFKKPSLILGLMILVLDSVSKYYVQHYLPISGYTFSYPYGGIGVFSNFFGIEFSLIHAVNKGIAWGALPSYQYAILWLRIFLILGLTGYLLFFNRETYYQIPLALIISGAIGNVMDYFTYGHVVDMFLFVFWGYHYPVFNIADSAIFLGVSSFIAISMIKKNSLENSKI